ncbi:hypothetical protein [Cetobacterium sp.]|uniref:hypothetical protein n=1 Tax=Cetobacterium sp. TaxID=2071632 RepID=UPI003F2C6553
MDNKEVNSYRLKIRFINRTLQKECQSSFFRKSSFYESDSKSVLLGIIEKISISNEYSYTLEKTTKKWDDYLKCYEIQSIAIIEEGSNV